MANPQTDEGYTRIVNEIIENLCRQVLGPDEWRLIMAIFRLTYGWHRRDRQIALSEFSKMTGMSRRNCLRGLKKLEARNMLSVVRTDTRKPSTYRFQKNYEKWNLLSELSTAKTSVVRTEDSLLSELSTGLLSEQSTDLLSDLSTVNIKKDKNNNKENNKEKESRPGPLFPILGTPEEETSKPLPEEPEKSKEEPENNEKSARTLIRVYFELFKEKFGTPPIIDGGEGWGDLQGPVVENLLRGVIGIVETVF